MDHFQRIMSADSAKSAARKINFDKLSDLRLMGSLYFRAVFMSVRLRQRHIDNHAKKQKAARPSHENHGRSNLRVRERQAKNIGPEWLGFFSRA